MASKLIDTIWNETRERIKETFTIENLVSFIPIIMQVVEKHGDLSGPEKKQLVLSIINKLIDIYCTDPNKIAILKAIPYDAIIESVIAATKGKFNINKTACC